MHSFKNLNLGNQQKRRTAARLLPAKTSLLLLQRMRNLEDRKPRPDRKGTFPAISICLRVDKKKYQSRRGAETTAERSVECFR